jgi:hypothetical protein
MGVSGQRYAPSALYPRAKDLSTHCTGGWMGPRAGLDTEARGKILLPLPGIEPRWPGPWSDIILTELPGSFCYVVFSILLLTPLLGRSILLGINYFTHIAFVPPNNYPQRPCVLEIQSSARPTPRHLRLNSSACHVINITRESMKPQHQIPLRNL